MKYLKLFENVDVLLSKEDIRNTITEMLNDDIYFSNSVPYAKRSEQFKRLMMLICHKKNELSDIRAILKNKGTNISWNSDKFNGLLADFIKQKLDEILDNEGNKLLDNIKEVLVEMVLENIEKKDNIQIYKHWINEGCIKEQTWLVNHPDLIQYKRQLDASLWDFNNKGKKK